MSSDKVCPGLRRSLQGPIRLWHGHQNIFLLGIKSETHTQLLKDKGNEYIESSNNNYSTHKTANHDSNNIQVETFPRSLEL